MSESDLLTALRTKLDQEVAADQFAGAVLIAKNGKPIFTAAYGLADREKKIPNKLGTRFRIGSMNKMFTATSILQLVQAGKIDLNAPLGKYLTDYPNKNVASKVTIHHLLTHTGGTGDFFGPQFDAHRLELRSLKDYVTLYGKARPGLRAGRPLGIQQLRFPAAGPGDRECERTRLLRLRSRPHLQTGRNDVERFVARR